MATFDFQKAGGQVKVTLSGQHDPFPWYEEYINRILGPYKYKSTGIGPEPFNLGPIGWYFRATIPPGETKAV